MKDFCVKASFVKKVIIGYAHWADNTPWGSRRERHRDKMANHRRGFVSRDETEFSEAALKILRRAAKNLQYLLNEGYAIKGASTFIGNHYQLSERQRLALVRSISSSEQLALREKKRCELGDLTGRIVYLDGFNLIITLEAALSGSFIFRGMDGTIRDLAGLRGTYRVIDVTEEAVRRIGAALERLQIKKAVFYLDAPVSNSGRLKACIAETWEQNGYSSELDIQVISDVDRVLGKQDRKSVV